MIFFVGSCFAVLVVFALMLSSVAQKLKPSPAVKFVPDEVNNDAQIINDVKSMHFAGYDDEGIALSLKIDFAIVEVIPKAISL